MFFNDAFSVHITSESKIVFKSYFEHHELTKPFLLNRNCFIWAVKNEASKSVILTT